MQNSGTIRLLLDNQEIFLMNPTITIKKRAGAHTEVMIRGVIKPESHSFLMNVSSMAELSLQFEDEREYLFCGLATYLDIQVGSISGGSYQELCLEAMSCTCLLDRDKKCAAFQKTSAAYREILDLILGNYPGSNYIVCPEAAGKTLDRFLVQYQETDWDFLARLASQMALPLVASHTTKGAKFTFGVIWKTNPYEIPAGDECRVEMIHDSFRKTDHRGAAPKGSRQFIHWETENPEAPVFEVGDCILYQGIQCYVKENVVEIVDHVRKQRCLLCGKRGFFEPEHENTFLTGLSLPGTVKEVKNNQLNIVLDLDALNEQECWFAYSTFYSTFYCMPEKGDRINLYFPDHLEPHAFVLNSVRTNPQNAAIGSASQGNSGSGEQEQQTDRGSGAPDQPQAEEPEAVDAAPLLRMLASPESGKLINVSAVYSGEQSGSQTGNTQDGGAQGGAQSSQGSASSAKGGGQQGYDFESLAMNEHVKVLCTKDGKMVILDDTSGSVSIVCDNGTYIKLGGKGITIESDQKLTFTSSGEIHINAGKILTLSAEECIEMDCESCGFQMTPEKIELHGTNIKINE